MTDEVKLIEVPDLAGQMRRQWPLLANRAAFLVLAPVLATLLARSLGYYEAVRTLPLPLGFLRNGPLAYEAKVIGTVILLAILIAYAQRKRTIEWALGICVLVVLWVGFIYSRLRWSSLVDPSLDLRLGETPSAAAWLFAGLLLLAGVVFALVEGLLRLRQDQVERDLPEDDATRLAATSLRGTAYALGGGLGLAAMLGLLFWGLAPALRGGFPHVNPVFGLLALALGLAVAFFLTARTGDEDEVDAAPPEAAGAKP